MNRLLIALTLVILTACSQKSEKRVIETYPGGDEKLIRYYANSQDTTATFREESFYENKKPKYQGEFVNSARNGKWIYYYENGNIWSEGYFKDDRNDGPRITYYENGQKRYEGSYREGVETGIWKFYDEEGKLIREVDFDKGQEGSFSDSLQSTIQSQSGQ